MNEHPRATKSQRDEYRKAVEETWLRWCAGRLWTIQVCGIAPKDGPYVGWLGETAKHRLSVRASELGLSEEEADDVEREVLAAVVRGYWPSASAKLA